jgi:hypothetical protein
VEGEAVKGFQNTKAPGIARGLATIPFGNGCYFFFFGAAFFAPPLAAFFVALFID